MTDPRDKRIAELEARVDKLVDAIAKLASERPTAYPVVITSPAPCTRPHADHGYWYVPANPPTTWQNPVTISQFALGGSVSDHSEIGTMLPRPSPTMTATG